MARMYDFGADFKDISANERKAFAWPIAVWACYIPESEAQDINILEHLILQLVKMGYKDLQTILCKKIGFNDELIRAAIESCKDKDYFDRRYSELTLSEDGRKMVDKYDNPYTYDLEASKKCKKIYMIQDLVTKSVIPVFDIERLPQFYYEDESAIEIRYENFTGKKPRSASQKTAMRYWARICQNKRKGIVNGTNTIDISISPDKKEIVEEYIPFEDEVEWEAVLNDEELSNNDYKTLADKEIEEVQSKQEDNINNLTIIDDSPEKYLARGYVAINRNAPDEVIIISPFGEYLDDWFRTVMNRLRSNDKNLEDELQLFLMDKREELKDFIAFGPDREINLFNEYPYICNDPSYKAVKRAIRELTVSKSRFENGSDETINFARSLRTAYEASFRIVVRDNPYLLDNKNVTYEQYKANLKILTDSYSFLDEEIEKAFSSWRIYDNVRNTSGNRGYLKSYIALMLLDSWNNKNGKAMDLLRNLPSYPLDIIRLEGNDASHGGDYMADMSISVKKAIKQYEDFETFFRALYNRFVEGR